MAAMLKELKCINYNKLYSFVGISPNMTAVSVVSKISGKISIDLRKSQLQTH